MPEPTLKATDWIPVNILNDPRHLVRECDACIHMLSVGLCGADLIPEEEWSQPEGCEAYAPLFIEAGGDQDPEDFLDYA